MPPHDVFVAARRRPARAGARRSSPSCARAGPARRARPRRPLAEGPDEAGRPARAPRSAVILDEDGARAAPRHAHRRAAASSTSRSAVEELARTANVREPPGSRPLRPNDYRDAWCGQVLADRVGSTVRVAGWVHRRRDHGGLVFIDLRDRTGLVQLVFNPDDAGRGVRARPPAARRGRALVAGEVVRRIPETVNPELPTGEFEVRVARGRRCWPTPRRRRSRSRASRARWARRLRLRHRYLDLRRERMRDAIELRHAVARGDPRVPRRRGLPRDRDADAHALDARGRARLPRPGAPRAGLLLRAAAVAAAVQAAADGRRVRALLPDRPLLSRRGPARRPPARLHPARRRDVVRRGRGRARPQRAAAGRTSSGAVGGPRSSCRCRGSPTTRRWRATAPTGRTCASGSSSSTSTDLLAETEFKVFRGAIEGGGVVKGLNAGARELPRSELDGLIERAQELGAKGLVWAFREGEGWRSPTAKFLSRGGARGAQRARSRPRRATCCCWSPTSRRSPTRSSAQLRLDLAERFELIDRGAQDVLLGRRLAAVRVERGRGALGPAPSPVHRARRRARPRATRARPGRWPTTSSGTARSSAAARSASPTPTSSSDVLEAIGIGRRGGARTGSASCSRRFATARRRTAGSPTGSTASCSGCSTRTRSAT